jgi:hypothetical protein
MNIIVLLCSLIIWASAFYGFITDDMGMGLFGRTWAAIAHGAIALLALAGLGGLIFVTWLAIKELV